MNSFYYTILIDHPLTGKRVDVDWRNQKEKALPYDEKNLNVVQNVLVLAVGRNCHGTDFIISDDYKPQAASRVIKVHEQAT